jgi:hypothetical protein
MHPLLTSRTRREALVNIRHSIRNYPLSKPIWKQQSKKGYEANHSAYKSVIICNRKQGHHSDRGIYEMITLNEIHFHPATSRFLVPYQRSRRGLSVCTLSVRLSISPVNQFSALFFVYAWFIWYLVHCLPYKDTDQVCVWFDPLIFHEVMALGLRKILRNVSYCCSTVPPPLPAMQSRIITNQNLVLLCLNHFQLNYTVDLACNTQNAGSQ